MFRHSEVFLSFIIPTTNDPRIQETITSIISSEGWSSHDCEIIVVVNNCPKYFYENLGKVFSSGRLEDCIKILYLRKGNIAKARNVGIKISKGQYVIHIDSDCKMAVDYIKKLKKYLSTQNFLIGRGLTKFIPANNLLSKANCELKKLAYFTRQKMTYTPNLIVKKELYKKVGLFDEKLFHGEDTEWSQRLKNFKVVPRFFSDLIIDHIDHKSILKIIMTYFHYGVGRTYRFKKALFKNNLTLRDKYSTYYQLFNEIPNFRNINSFINKIIILFLYLVRDIGVIYGLFKWNVVK